MADKPQGLPFDSDDSESADRTVVSPAPEFDEEDHTTVSPPPEFDDDASDRTAVSPPPQFEKRSKKGPAKK